MITTPEITLSAISKDIRKTTSNAVVVGVGQGSDGPVLLDGPLPAKVASALKDSLSALGITGAADEVRRLPGIPELNSDVLVLAGVGKLTGASGTELSTEALRRAAGSAIRQLAGLDTVVLALPTNDVAHLAAAAEGAALGAFSYNGLKTGKNPTKAVANVVLYSAVATAPEAKVALRRAVILAKAVHATRVLVNEPPSHLYPETFAEASKNLAKGLPVKVTVLDEKRLEKEGYGGILGVGQGSSRPPRLVKVEYTPAKAKASLALVGKGITFDSGGISLKPAASMMTMKSDMAGAAAVLNALLAIAELALPIKVT
nr:leucyl aminopeptidase [Acidobacteriota bacterium]